MNDTDAVVTQGTPPLDSGGTELWREKLSGWLNTFAQTDWRPWMIVGFGAFLRFFLLAIKPPHFDEGINGWFVDQLVKTGYYRYDPTNYHGPLHFYVLFLSQTLFGRNLWALRLPVVVISSLCVWLTLKFEPFVGRKASWIAAVAMTISPGFIFYGRYSIHEVWLQLFSMMFILGLLGLWKRGTSNYLWCLGMGLTGMILTKETYIMHVGCAVIAIACTWLTSLDVTGGKKQNANPLADPRFAAQSWDLVDLGMVIAVGTGLILFFYSGAFMHWSGIKGLYECMEAWFTTGREGHGHEKPWYYWLKLIIHYEWPAAFGFVLCLFAGWFRNICVRYLAIYGVGTIIAYSIVSYKTPWCIISIIWPLFFIFGVAANTRILNRRIFYGALGALAGAILAVLLSYWFLPGGVREQLAAGSKSYFRAMHELIWLNSGGDFSTRIDTAFFISLCALVVAGGLAGIILDTKLRPGWLSEAAMNMVRNVVVVFALAGSLVQAIALNYFHCTNDTEPYVYVQTYNDIFKLTDPVLTLTSRDPVNKQMNGHIIRTSSYPLPWIFGDMPHIGYYEHEGVLPDKVDADFLLVQPERVTEVEAKLHNTYFTEPLTIRPYQETSKLYFDAKRFKEFFPNRNPDFVGKASG